MNSSENPIVKRAIKALATLRQKMQPEIDKILEIEPNLMKIESPKQLPKEKVTDITHQYLCMRLVRPDESIDDDIDILVAPMLSVENKELIDWYKNEYKPFMDKVFMVVLGVETSSGSIPSIRSKLVMVVDLAESWIRIKEASGADGFENLFGLQKFKKFMEKSYFEPDEWIANEADLHTIFVTRDTNKIVTHIRSRIYEIYYSFVFGNYMAAIALFRCLLEYALIDSKPLLERRLKAIETDLGAEIFRCLGKTKDWNRDRWGIGDRASVFAVAFSDLKNSMDCIIDNGNEIMHPAKKVTPTPARTKDQAKDCFNAVSKVIGTLYGETK